MKTKLMVHPDDLLFFNEVSAAMRRVARDYSLTLSAIELLPMPLTGMADRMGDCSSTGVIRMVLRCTIDGVWCEAPLSPAEVWETAAHELAHLRYRDHGPNFQSFVMELRTALDNKVVDHRDKVLARLVKMQAQRDGEAKLGNSDAAEAFAAAINRMLIENELHPSDIDYARTMDNDPVIKVLWVPSAFSVKPVSTRVAWQESLARIVARANLCTFLIHKGSNIISFVGTKAHATVAEYTFGTLVAAADKLSYAARHAYRESLRERYGVKDLKQTGDTTAFGFRESWLTAFIDRIAERFAEARKAAVAQADASMPGATSTAIMRLDGALIRSQAYVDNMFSGRKIRYAKTLRNLQVNNEAGAAQGRSAANRMAIGRKGIEGATTGGRKLLTK